VLLVLLLLLIGTVVSAYLRWPRQKSVEKLKYAAGVAAPNTVPAQKEAAPVVDDGRILRLDLLDRDQCN